MPADGSQARTSAPVDLPVDLILVRKRQRPVDPERVANYRVSMRENGFFGAITVRPVQSEERTLYELVVGAHRLTAWKLEGGRTIPAQIRILTDDEALQIEIDENLVDEGLSPLERAEMVATRFEVWKRRFPDRVAADESRPKRGRPGNSVNLTELTGGVPETMGFAAETATRVGLSESTVKRAFGVVANIPADLRRKLHGTAVARNDSLLRQLAALGDKREQAAVAQLLIDGKTKSVSDARAYAAGNEPSKPAQTPVDEAVKAFRALWAKASPSARTAILHDLAGRRLPAGYVVRGDDA